MLGAPHVDGFGGGAFVLGWGCGAWVVGAGGGGVAWVVDAGASTAATVGVEDFGGVVDGGAGRAVADVLADGLPELTLVKLLLLAGLS